MLTTEQIIAKYGRPDEDGSDYLVTIQLPYPMRLAWDKNTKVTRTKCHKLIAEPLKSVFNDLLTHYGMERIQALGIDIYGGCFNFRQMRGGTDYSRHSWGIAIDIDPERNSLKMSALNAQFAREEYKPMMEIFYRHGFVNLGVEKNYDYMHFEIKS